MLLFYLFIWNCLHCYKIFIKLVHSLLLLRTSLLFHRILLIARTHLPFAKITVKPTPVPTCICRHKELLMLNRICLDDLAFECDSKILRNRYLCRRVIIFVNVLRNIVLLLSELFEFLSML